MGFAGATSAGAPSAGGAEPLINPRGIAYLKDMIRKRPEPKPETPLQKRGRKLVEGLRNGKGKEPVGMHRSDPRIGVALGGGASRGLTHIPYIEAMDELGI